MFMKKTDINKYVDGEGPVEEKNVLDFILKDVARLNFKSKITFDDEFYNTKNKIDSIENNIISKYFNNICRGIH